MTEQSGPGLEDLKDVVRADVYKAHGLAGHLTRNGAGGINFTYTADWVRNGGPPIATTLPVSHEPVVTPAGAVPPFFAGLLPEGRRLGALRRSVKTSGDDDLTLLLGIGGNTVGDVSVLAEGLSPTQVMPRLQIDSFEEVSFTDLLADLDIRVDRVGLPGVQDKVSAAMLNVPAAVRGTELLLKLNPAEFRHIVENENFFLTAASSAGIPTVTADLVRDRTGEAGLAVTRFDRVVIDGERVALAVEDGCQVQGRYPAAKYSVTTEDLLWALTQVCESPRAAAAEFLAQAAFAYLSGNGDAHAKNFSVLQDHSGRWRPTPAYDLPSSQPYGDTTMALSVGGLRAGNIPGSRYVTLGRNLGVPERAARKILTRVADSADVWLDGLKGLPFDSARIKKLQRVVITRQRMLRTL